MTKALSFLIASWLLCTALAAAEPQAGFNAEASLVEIEVTKKSYDYKIPWVIRNNQTRKNGIVIGDRQILTTADGLSGQYLCRIRKGGVSKQYTATLSWVDYYSNLALLNVEDTAFWEGMEPVSLVDQLPLSGNLQVFRWRSGRIESRAAEIIRLFIGPSKMSYIQHLKLSASCEIDSAGWAEVVINDGQLIGLTTSAANEKLTILPATFIQAVLQRRTLDSDPGAGCFDFRWMSAKNPALVQSKGFQRSETGVVITEVGARRLADNTLHSGDILFEIDGFEIDNEGKYVDPEYGRLSMSGLATRAHNAGDSMPMKVWRDGEAVAVNYTLPQADFEKSLIPERRFDREPSYLIAGGLVFQPLEGPLLAALGKNKPVLIDYYNATADEDREGLVLLSMVLPDDFNRGYESARMLIVDQINEQPISNLEEVVSALEAPVEGFHHIRFMHDEVLQHMVLDAATLNEATTRILQHYRIPAAQSL
ncbi:MAG: hypothetical protein HRT56_01740 [Coraliomargarita sp.]|nr:hypothetical protein [Coraliomargarita sp.]